MWTKHPCSRWARSGCSDSVLGTRRWRSCHSETSNCVICIWWIFRCVHTVVTAGVNQNEPFWRFSARWNSGRVESGAVTRSSYLLYCCPCLRVLAAALFLFLSPIGRSGMVSCFHSNRCQSLGPPSTSSLARSPGVFWVKCCKQALCKCL